MTFTYPWLLTLLVAPAAIALWEWKRRGHRVWLPLDHGRQRPLRWLGWTVRTANLLPAALLAMAILILCRPVQSRQPDWRQRLTNIEIVLDVSGSMSEELGGATRFDAAMEAVNDFTLARQGDACGLTIFGDEVLRWTPLTRDLAAVRNAAPFVRPETLPTHMGGTRIGKALRFTQESMVGRGEGDRLVILVSDGNSADLGGNAAMVLGERLAESEIVLYAIHVGEESPPDSLYGLTRPSRGRVFAATTPQALSGVFAQIDRMQPIEMLPGAPRTVDNYLWLAMAGLGTLAAYQLAMFGLRYTPW